MSYTDIFGGSPVQPAEVSYRAISLTSDVTLYWPASYQDTTNVVSKIMDVTPGAAGWSITFPNATLVGEGEDSLVRNLGSDSFTLKDYGGNTIGTVAAGTAYYMYLTDNSTTAGTWRIVQFGAGSSSVDASALAGYGLLSAGGVLSQSTPVQTKAADYTVVNGDRASLIVYTGGAGTLTLTAAATLGSNFYVYVRNSGTGALTVDPNASETIDGAASMTINQTESAMLVCDGTGWYSVGYGRSVASSTTRLSKSVAGGSNVTLTSSEAANAVIDFTGILTANINVIVPTSVAVYYLYNNTTGSYTLTVKTAAGTGVAITQGDRYILECDGTNVVNTLSGSSGTVTSVATGTGLSGGPITTTGTIALANTAVAAGSYSAANITVDAQGRLTAATDAEIRLLASYQS